MANLNSIASMALLGLQANQQAIGVTANNIANVNTEGYTRQRPIFRSLTQGGVELFKIERLRDQFLDVRLRGSNSRLGARVVESTNLELMESMLTASEGSGIGAGLQKFFNSLQDLTAQPSGAVERQSFLSQAQSLIGQINSTEAQLTQIRRDIDKQLRQEIEKVNTTLKELVQLNRSLNSQPHDADVSSLLDQRDQLIDRLSSRFSVRVITDDRGVVTLFAGDGVTILEGINNFEFVAVADPGDSGFLRVAITGTSSTKIIIDDRLDQGSLGQLVRSRDQDARDMLDRIDRLSAELIRSFNAQHRLGRGLDDTTGNDFFTGLAVTSASGLENLGQASIGGGTITDESQLTFDDYEIRFTATGPLRYDVVDVTTGATLSTGNVYTSGNPIAFDGMTVTITDGAAGPAVGDVFKVNSYSATSRRIALDAAVKDKPRAIAVGLTSTPGDNENALALAALRDASLLNSGSMTFEEFFDSTRSALGLKVEAAITRLSGEEIAQFQIQGLADSARGVSIDEEAVNLLQYQRAFEASSRLIVATNELMQTIINLI